LKHTVKITANKSIAANGLNVRTIVIKMSIFHEIIVVQQHQQELASTVVNETSFVRIKCSVSIPIFTSLRMGISVVLRNTPLIMHQNVSGKLPVRYGKQKYFGSLNTAFKNKYRQSLG